MKHLIVMGVSGSGKTTLARMLAGCLGWAYAEADDFHPPANVAKMSSGQPLGDGDRWPWLRAIHDWTAERERAGEHSVVTCSALKRAYRDLLREAGGEELFVHLHGTRGVLESRMARRTGHFMPVSLLDSQLAALEMPGADEPVLTLDIARPPEELVEQTVHFLAQQTALRGDD